MPCWLYSFSDGAKGIPILAVTDSDPILGETVTFICHEGNTTANPEVDQVKWIKDGETLDDNDLFEYVIDKVTYEHNGTYKCQLGNDHGFSNVSNSIVLSVNYSPLCKCVHIVLVIEPYMHL